MMLFQRFLALFDKAISEVFWLQAWGTGDEKSNHQWIYLVDVGPTIGIVSEDGKVRTMMSYWSVRHYYDGRGKLLKRVPIRKDLKNGERLATQEEIALHREEMRKQFSETSRGMVEF